MEYENLPDDVKDAVPDPNDEDGAEYWQSVRAEPDDISVGECACCDDDLFDVPMADENCWHCDARQCFVDDCGETVHGVFVGDPGSPESGYNLALDDDDVEDASHIMCGYCAERHGEGNTVIIVTPDGESFGAKYQGTVIRDASPYGEGSHEALYEAPEAVWDMLSALVRGTHYVSTDAWRGYHTGPDEADGLVKVSGGWHSSMERSELSDRINALTSGEFHRDVYRVGDERYIDMSDAVCAVEEYMFDGDEVTVQPDSLDVPVAVVFARTSNVCSTSIDVYAPETAVDDVESVLDATAAPVYAGV